GLRGRNNAAGFDISGAALRAVHAIPAFVGRKIECYTAGAHPTTLPGRITIYQSVIGDVASDHRAGADKGIPSDSDPADYRAVGAKRRAAAYQGSLIFVSADHVASRIDHVSEYHRRAAEDVVFQNAACIYRDIILDFDVISNHHIGGNHYILA